MSTSVGARWRALELGSRLLRRASTAAATPAVVRGRRGRRAGIDALVARHGSWMSAGMEHRLSFLPLAVAIALGVAGCGTTASIAPDRERDAAPADAAASPPEQGDRHDAGSSRSDAGAGAAGPGGCTGCADDECCKDGMCWPGSSDDACGSNGVTCATCSATTACRQGLALRGQPPPEGLELRCLPALGDGTSCTDGQQCKGGYCTNGKCAGAACLPAGASCSPQLAGCCSGMQCGGSTVPGGLGACCYAKGSALPKPPQGATPGPCCEGSPVPVNGTDWKCL